MSCNRRPMLLRRRDLSCRESKITTLLNTEDDEADTNDSHAIDVDRNYRMSVDFYNAVIKP